MCLLISMSHGTILHQMGSYICLQKEFKLMLGDSLEVDLPVTFVRMSLTVSESVPPLEVTLQYKTSDVYPHKVDVRFSKISLRTTIC